MKNALTKKLRNGLCMLLAAAMALSAPGAAMSVEAEGTDVKSYVSLGDSMTNGYGLDGYEEDGRVNGYLQEAPEAYPARLAEHYGWDLTQLAISAMRAEDLHYVLDYGTEGAYAGDYYTYDEFIDNRFNDFLEVPGKEALAGYQTVANQFQTSVAEADVVSVCIGNANFGVFLLGRLTGALGILGDSAEGDAWIEFENALAECDEETKTVVMNIYEQVKAEIVNYVPAEQAEFVDHLTNVIGYTVASYALNYNGALDRIVELNPDAEIILVGIMNTMSGLDVDFTWEGQTYTIDMGDILAPVIESVNFYIAALPATKQALDIEAYDDVTFYYAEADGIEMLVSEYAIAAEDWSKYPIVRDRFIEEVCDTVFPMLDMGLVEITRADIEEYENMLANGYAAFAQYAGANTAKAQSCAIYLAFEDAVVNASVDNKLNAEAFVKLATGLDGIFDSVLAGYQANVQVGVAANYETVYKALAEAVILPQLHANGNPDATLEDALVHLSETSAGETFAQEVTSLCTLLATPEALSDALIEDETVYGLLNLFARMLIGDGIGCHPSATGHESLTTSIIESYGNGFTAADAVEGKVLSAMEDLLALLEEYGPEAIEAAYQYAEENGYIDQLEAAADELIAQAKAELENYAEEVKPQIEAAIAELEAQLEALEAELAAKEAELTQKIAELKTLLEEKKAELENASEELKAEIEAAIGTLEAAIGTLEAAIEVIEEQIAQIENAIAELKAELEEIAAEMGALVAAGEELKAAIEELVATATGEIEGSIEDAVTKVQAAAAKVQEAIEAAETVKEAIEAAIEGAAQLTEVVKEALGGIDEGINNAIEEVKASVNNAIAELEEEIKAALEEKVAEIEATVVEIATEAIEEAVGALEAAANGLYDDAMALLDEVIAEAKAALEAAYADATTDDYTVSEDSYYVALGDKSAYAYGLEDGADGYVEKLAAALGLADTQYNNLSTDCENIADCAAAIANNADEVAKSDLVTIGFTNNTYVANAIKLAANGVEVDWATYLPAEAIPYIEEAVTEVKQYLLDSGVDEENAAMLTLAIESYAYSYVEYACVYPELVNAVHAINPEAVVIIVGMYNPLDGVVLDLGGEEGIAIGEYIDYIVEIADLHATAYAMLTNNAIFVSAPEVETIKSAEQMGVRDLAIEYVVNLGVNLHANDAGHEYIKDQILGALNVTVAEPEPEEPTGLLGDVNVDGKVNTGDVNMLYRYVGKTLTTEISEQGLINADVNGDGQINTGDVNKLYRYVGKTISTLE